MYMNGLDCECAVNKLNGLGIGWESLVPAAASLITGGGKSSGGGMPMPMPSITTSVNTQVSPQISPVFIQQEKPVDSPVNAGTTMGTPVTGAMPGFDAASGYLPSGLPGIPSYMQGTNSFDKRLLLIPAGILLAILLFKKRKTVNTYTRRAGSYAKARIHRATAS